MSKAFFTARELAEIAKAAGINSFPNTETGVRRMAKRAGWNDLDEALTRRRTSGERGGRPSLEYHYSLLLPMLMQSVKLVAELMIQLSAHE